MKVTVYNENIIHLEFPNLKELTMTMCRPQEFYECDSDVLRGKVFTVEELVDHFTDKDGHFNYFCSWAGFNIPSPILEQFFLLFTLTDREQKLRDVTIKSKDKTYYIICTILGDKVTFKHELIHAHYYLNSEYRKDVDVLIRHMDKNVRKQLIKELKKLGYAKHVIYDEINAYMATGGEELDLDVSEEDMKPFVDLARKILRV